MSHPISAVVLSENESDACGGTSFLSSPFATTLRSRFSPTFFVVDFMVVVVVGRSQSRMVVSGPHARGNCRQALQPPPPTSWTTTTTATTARTTTTTTATKMERRRFQEWPKSGCSNR
eukprot:3109509-Pyramimonas_sp.AAC.1